MANVVKMTVPKEKENYSADQWSRAIMRRALKASMATLNRNTGTPYASLIIVAAMPDNAPVTLISTLAEHTKNIEHDPRASILFDETDGHGDPLEGARVSVFGTLKKAENASVRDRFLRRHPSAKMYVDFADFDFYSLNVEGAHFVGGFGRITDIPADGLKVDTSDADALIGAETEIVAHMNEDHADAVELYATKLLGAAAGPWRFVSCDPEGCDLVCGESALRLDFPRRVTTPQEVRKALVDLAQMARE